MENEKILYTLIRTDRKTAAIRILSDGSVEVRAPKRLAKVQIDRFVAEKQDWIRAHRGKMLEKCAERARTDPMMLWYLGRPCPLTAWEKNTASFDGTQFWVPAFLLTEENRAGRIKTIAALYRRLAQTWLPARTAEIVEAYGLSMPETVTITSAAKRWGSCSGASRIHFSWRLMAAPQASVDYVILHELCHMREMNHSSRFWAMVEACMPDWKSRRAALEPIQQWLTGYFEET